MHGKAEDAGGLTPAKDDNAAMRALHPRAFARNFGDCYKGPVCRTYPIDGPSFGWNSGAQRKEWNGMDPPPRTGKACNFQKR